MKRYLIVVLLGGCLSAFAQNPAAAGKPAAPPEKTVPLATLMQRVSELEQQREKLKTDYIAVDGAIQALQQLIAQSQTPPPAKPAENSKDEKAK